MYECMSVCVYGDCSVLLLYVPLYHHAAVWLVHEQVVDGGHPVTAIPLDSISDLRLTHLQEGRHQLNDLARGGGRGREY